MGEPYEEGKSQSSGYLGSVAFFKHMILGTVFLMIAVPIVICCILAFKNHQLRTALAKQNGAAPENGSFSLAAETVIPADEGQGSWAQGPVDRPHYSTLFPDMVVDQPDRNAVQEENVVYLTFDDGPSRLTDQVLDLLAEYDVKATFFTVGKDSETAAERMRRIIDEGHTLGMHSYSHDYGKVYASVEDYLEDIHRMYELIYEATEVYPTIFRFVGGSINAYNSAFHQELTAEMLRRGFVYFDWNATDGDAVTKVPSAQVLAENALRANGHYSRIILLMHDSAGKENILEALPLIIQGYKDAGYTFAALTPEVTPVVFSYTD